MFFETSSFVRHFVDAGREADLGGEAGDTRPRRLPAPPDGLYHLAGRRAALRKGFQLAAVRARAPARRRRGLARHPRDRAPGAGAAADAGHIGGPAGRPRARERVHAHPRRRAGSPIPWCRGRGPRRRCAPCCRAGSPPPGPRASAAPRPGRRRPRSGARPPPCRRLTGLRAPSIPSWGPGSTRARRGSRGRGRGGGRLRLRKPRACTMHQPSPSEPTCTRSTFERS